MNHFDRYVAQTLAIMQQRIAALETELREIRALLTPLDPGSLPAPSDPQETKR